MSTLFDQNKKSDATESVEYGFDSIIGQPRVKSILGRTIRNGRIGNAYLFCGPDGTGKDAMAIEFSKALNCSDHRKRPCNVCRSCKHIGEMSHPDIKFVFPRPKVLDEEAEVGHLRNIAQQPYRSTAFSATAEILIDQIRELKKIAGLKIHHGNVRVFILSGVERMRVEAANSLLKLLEEPPQKLILILTTGRKEKLLSTIVSRCQTIYFSLLDKRDVKERLLQLDMEPARADALSNMAMGSFGKALELSEDDMIQFRDEAFQLLKSSFNKNVLDRMDQIEQAAHGKSRGEVKELLLYALAWLRDFRIQQIASDREERNGVFHNSDRVDLIEESAGLFSLEKIDNAIEVTESYISLIEKNAYVNLVLINYLNHLYMLRGNISEPRATI